MGDEDYGRQHQEILIFPLEQMVSDLTDTKGTLLSVAATNHQQRPGITVVDHIL